MIKPVRILGLRAIFDDIIKFRKVPAAMIKNPVNDNTHLPTMHFFDQITKIFICSKIQRDMKVVQQIVFVIGACRKNRI